MDFKVAYKSLSDPDVTKRDYDAAKAALSKHAECIWRYICKQSDRMNWDYLKSEIDPEVVVMYGDFSEFVTEVDGSEFENPHYKYVNGFPTELLWEADWRAIVDKHIADAIEKFTVERRDKLAKNKIKKQAKIARQKETINRIGKLQTAILEKTKVVLTDEEYMFLIKNFQIPSGL